MRDRRNRGRLWRGREGRLSFRSSRPESSLHLHDSMTWSRLARLAGSGEPNLISKHLAGAELLALHQVFAVVRVRRVGGDAAEGIFHLVHLRLENGALQLRIPAAAVLDLALEVRDRLTLVARLVARRRELASTRGLGRFE